MGKTGGGRRKTGAPVSPKPKKLVGRDPETGQFVSGSHHDHYEDIEVVSFGAGIGVAAADMTGGTGFTGGDVHEFEGVELIDYDEIVDRNEELVLLQATHSLSVFANSTESEDGTVVLATETSASPSSSPVLARAAPSNVATEPGDATGLAANDDSIDLVGRPMIATGHAPFSDTATGVGGGGSAGEDRLELENLPLTVARFHPRDQLFFNGRFVAWNIDDAGIHCNLFGQHIYGVQEA